MPKPFIFLLIIWNSFSFASGNTGTNDLQFLLGCQAVIPCQLKRSYSDSFRWFYKKDEHSQTIGIFLQNEKGLQFHHASHPKGSVMHNRSLVISYFKEDNQGLYWCENCYKVNCEKSTVIRVKKVFLGAVRHETCYVTAGNSFTHVCPGEFPNLRWTFKASTTTNHGISEVRSEADFVTSNKSIHIVNVKTADAGKYICLTNRCDGQSHELLTINLCVITVHQSGDSSVSCAVICDVDFTVNKSNISNEETCTSMISVHVGSLNCSAEQIFDLQVTTSNSTHAPSNASNKTTGTVTKSEYLTPVIYGTSLTLGCLILMALLIFYFRSRSQADFSGCASGCDIDDREEETSVVYASIVIRRPANTTNYHKTYSDCVYSEIH